MITQSIERYHPPVHRVKGNKPKYVIGSVPHKQYILDNNYNSVIDKRGYEPGEEWYAKGHKGAGIIIDVVKDISLVEWDGLKVKFIELWMHDENNSFLFHPSDLRRKR